MLNSTFHPSLFRTPLDLSPAKVASWYEDYTARRGRWQALARIASDDNHACNAHFLAEALLATSTASVRRYEFRAAGGHQGQRYPGAIHESEIEYAPPPPHTFLVPPPGPCQHLPLAPSAQPPSCRRPLPA